MLLRVVETLEEKCTWGEHQHSYRSDTAATQPSCKRRLGMERTLNAVLTENTRKQNYVLHDPTLQTQTRTQGSTANVRPWPRMPVERASPRRCSAFVTKHKLSNEWLNSHSEQQQKHLVAMKTLSHRSNLYTHTRIHTPNTYELTINEVTTKLPR